MVENIYARQAAAFRNEMRQSCAALVGIVQGVLADGELHDREIRFLRDWLSQSESVSLLWPGSAIQARINHALADGVVTPDERAHLVQTLEALLGGALDELADSPLVTRLAIDEGVSVQHQDRAFCFTGDFVFGPRSVCEKAVVARGGSIGGVTKKLHYLIVGGLGSAEWKHGSFGTKVEKAVQYRSQGVPLAILHEDAWASTLGA